MHLREYSDEQLIENVRGLARAEKRLVTALLHHLNEIARRRLYAKESCPSLFRYCVKELAFSEGQARTRIGAARLMKEFPEIEQKISDGTLQIVAVSLAQQFFYSHSLPIEKKKEILIQIESKPAREVQQIFRTLDPSSFREVVRPISETLTEYRFAADKELTAKLDRLKNVLRPTSFEQLVQKMADVTLQKYDPLKKAERNLEVANQRNASTTLDVIISRSPRHIPAHIRHTVWLRDQGRCTFPECGSEYALELDHIVPYAHGGPHSVENLRLRCRAHNQLYAQEKFGEKKMSTHRRS